MRECNTQISNHKTAENDETVYQARNNRDYHFHGAPHAASGRQRQIEELNKTVQDLFDMLDDQIVEDLSEIISSHPGKTKLFFQLRDSQGKNHVLLRSKNEGVDVRHTLIDYIENHEMLDYQIN